MKGGSAPMPMVQPGAFQPTPAQANMMWAAAQYACAQQFAMAQAYAQQHQQHQQKQGSAIATVKMLRGKISRFSEKNRWGSIEVDGTPWWPFETDDDKTARIGSNKKRQEGLKNKLVRLNGSDWDRLKLKVGDEVEFHVEPDKEKTKWMVGKDVQLPRPPQPVRPIQPVRPVQVAQHIQPGFPGRFQPGFRPGFQPGFPMQPMQATPATKGMAKGLGRVGLAESGRGAGAAKAGGRGAGRGAGVNDTGKQKRSAKRGLPQMGGSVVSVRAKVPVRQLPSVGTWLNAMVTKTTRDMGLHEHAKLRADAPAFAPLQKGRLPGRSRDFSFNPVAREFVPSGPSAKVQELQAQLAKFQTQLAELKKSDAGGQESDERKILHKMVESYKARLAREQGGLAATPAHRGGRGGGKGHGSRGVHGRGGKGGR